MRQALATPLRVVAHACKTHFTIGVIGFLKPFWRPHDTVLIGAALTIALLVQREKVFHQKLSALFDHRLINVGRSIAVFGNFTRDFTDIKQLLHHEFVVAVWRLINIVYSHGLSPSYQKSCRIGTSMTKQFFVGEGR